MRRLSRTPLELGLAWVCVLLALLPGLAHSGALAYPHADASHGAMHGHAHDGPQLAASHVGDPSLEHTSCPMNGLCCGFWVAERWGLELSLARQTSEIIPRVLAPPLQVPKPPPKVLPV